MPIPKQAPWSLNPTQEILDDLLVEIVDRDQNGFVRLPAGTPHPDRGRYPGYRHAGDVPVDGSEHLIRRYWSTDYANQDAYNYGITYDADSISHPSWARRYLVRRDQYAAVTTLTAFTGIFLIRVTTGGGNYAVAPAVTFTGGGGTGATAVALMQNGAVSWVRVTAEGSGYTSAPTIGFTGGGGSGAAATALMQGTAKLTKQDFSELPADDPRRSIFVAVTRLYETLPGAIVTTLQPHSPGLLRRITRQAVLPDTLPTEPSESNVLTDKITGVSTTKAMRETATIVGTDGDALDGLATDTTQEWDDEARVMIYTDHIFANSDTTIPEIDSVYPAGNLNGTLVLDIHRMPLPDSDKYELQVVYAATPLAHVDYPQEAFTRPGHFIPNQSNSKISVLTEGVVSEVEFGLGGGHLYFPIGFTAPANLSIMDFVVKPGINVDVQQPRQELYTVRRTRIYRGGPGARDALLAICPKAWSGVKSPGASSKRLGAWINNDMVHPAFDVIPLLYTDAGFVNTPPIERFDASDPPSFDGTQMLVLAATVELWKGGFYRMTIIDLAPDLAPKDYALAGEHTIRLPFIASAENTIDAKLANYQGATRAGVLLYVASTSAADAGLKLRIAGRKIATAKGPAHPVAEEFVTLSGTANEVTESANRYFSLFGAQLVESDGETPAVATGTITARVENSPTITSLTFTGTAMGSGAAGDTVTLSRTVGGNVDTVTYTWAASVAGVRQVETITIGGDAVAGGDVIVTVTSDEVTGSPLTFNVTVGALDTADTVTALIQVALNASAPLTEQYTAGYSGSNLTLTRQTAEANDGTLLIEIDGTTNGTGVPDSSSVNTTAGVSPVNLILWVDTAADKALALYSALLDPGDGVYSGLGSTTLAGITSGEVGLSLASPVVTIFDPVLGADWTGTGETGSTLTYAAPSPEGAGGAGAVVVQIEPGTTNAYPLVNFDNINFNQFDFEDGNGKHPNLLPRVQITTDAIFVGTTAGLLGTGGFRIGVGVLEGQPITVKYQVSDTADDARFVDGADVATGQFATVGGTPGTFIVAGHQYPNSNIPYGYLRVPGVAVWQPSDYHEHIPPGGGDPVATNYVRLIIEGETATRVLSVDANVNLILSATD